MRPTCTGGRVRGGEGIGAGGGVRRVRMSVATTTTSTAADVSRSTAVGAVSRCGTWRGHVALSGVVGVGLVGRVWG
jgi:hypothetical protein